MPGKHKVRAAKNSSWEPQWLQKLHVPNWVVAIIALVFVFRLPALFEPYHAEHEMIALTIGESLSRGSALYTDIYTANPPLLYLLSAATDGVFWLRATLLIWTLITIAFFWKLADAIFIKSAKSINKDAKWIVAVAVLSFSLLVTLPVVGGHAVSADMFMIGPAIAAFALLYPPTLNRNNVLLGGILLGIASLFSLAAIYYLVAVLLFWVMLHNKNANNSIKIPALVFGFLAPIAVFVLWIYATGAGVGYIKEVYITYFSAWISEYSFVVPILIALSVILSTAYYFRAHLTKGFMFICLWTLLAAIAAFYPEASEHRNLVLLAAPFSLLVGILVARQTREQALAVLPIFAILAGVSVLGFSYNPIVPYYSGFVQMLTGKIDNDRFYLSFSPSVEHDYEVARFVRSSSSANKNIFVWGENSPTIYALSKRKPATKYIRHEDMLRLSSQEEIYLSLKNERPYFVILTPGAPEFPLLRTILNESYVQVEQLGGSSIWKSTNLNNLGRLM